MGSRPGSSRAAAPSPEGLADYVLEEQVGHLLRRANQRHLALFQSGFGAAPITSMQFATLVTLWQRGPLSQNLLGRLLAMDPPTVKGVVARLQARGLVTRAADPADARLKRVLLTAAARARLPALVAAGQRVTAATLAPLAPEEQAQFLALLRRLA